MFPNREREYWRRTSNGNRRMEHYELEDVFGRRLRPLLRVGLKLIDLGDGDEQLRFTFLNEGRGVAKHPGLLCFLSDDPGLTVGMVDGGMRNVTSVNDGRASVQYYDAQGVIHPNSIFAAAGSVRIRRHAKDSALSLLIHWYAEGMAARQARVAIKSNGSRLI